MEFVNSLNKYIPSLVLSQWITKADTTQLSLPEIQSLETVVLFADISGFTMISEACASMGVRGNEELAFCINRYMEGMVKSLGKYGGDIIKFVGDAMIVMWPRIQYTMSDKAVSPTKSGAGGALVGGSKEQQDDKVSIVRKAIQCAIDIQTDLNNKKIMSNVTNLSVKIGIGFGDCALLYVGGVFNRAEFFTVGDALTQALKSEECATAGGQIIVSQKAWSQVASYFHADEIIDDHEGKHFYKITGMQGGGIKSRADAVLLRNLVQQETYAKIQKKLQACVPAAIMPYLEIGYEQFGSETRRLSVMFASLGVDLSSANSRVGMEKIQRIVTTVQQQVYRLQGSVNKLVMDDKGSTLICIWGLSPMAHEDDAARAILTAMNMRRELAKIDNTSLNVGISTGEVFSGVVGTSGSRKEFSVLGDFVNLAARIMYWPKKHGDKGKIYVDLQTKKEADNFIKFDYHAHCEFKGKSISIPIFEPIDPEDEAQVQIKKLKSHECFLKIHANPFLVDKNSDYKRKLCKQIGREQITRQIQDDLLEFFDKENKQDQAKIIAILGEPGSGKTLMAKCLIESLKKNKNFLRDQFMGQDFLPILSTSINSESQFKFMNIWRPILQMMLIIHCKRNNMKPERAIRRILKSHQQDKLDIICEILNIPSIPSNHQQVTALDFHDSFVQRQRYPDEAVDSILDFMIEFIKEVIGDKDDYYSEVDNPSQVDLSQSQMTTYNLNSEPCPLVLILDTVYLMDEASWKLLELVKDECTKIAVVMLVQTDTNNQPKVDKEARNFYNEAFGSNMDDIKVIDLPPFKIEELSSLLVDLSSKYQASMLEEIHMMTFIEDPALSIKNPEQCKKKEKEFRDKYQVANTFSSVSPDVLEVTLRRCEGNPFVSLSFIYNMITNGFLEIKDYQLQGNENFKKCMTRGDWSTVPIPAFTSKINTTLLDSFLKDMRGRAIVNKVEGEFAIKGLLLLKSASVIGDVFGSKALQQISPLRHESHKSILSILKILEQQDFIEILDETDQKNAICRFRKCFLRETIYQIMLYRDQKKGLHQLLAQFIQNNPNSIDQDAEIEADKLLNHILIGEDLEKEDQIPFKAKQGLIVKKIANKLMKAPNAVIKSGYLTKQGNKPNKNIAKRLMVLRSKDISWYHNETEYRRGHPLGVIYLTAAYHCMAANRFKNTSDISIGTCAWRKKNLEKEGKREFIFGAENEMERDEWISSIEYLRTKAVYDKFVQNYCNITFPLRKNSEEKKHDDRDTVLSQIQEFGNKFKVQARFTKISPSTSPKPSGRNSYRSSRITKIGSYGQFHSELVQANAINNPKDIAQKMKKLYNISMVSFLSQITTNSIKTQRAESIRRVPDYLRTSSMFANEGDGSTSEVNYRDKPSSSHSIHSEEISEVDPYRRRKSEYIRKEVMADDFDVKTYISDPRAGGGAGSSNSPGGVSDMKITEENEDESSGSNHSAKPTNRPRDRSQNVKNEGFTQLVQEKFDSSRNTSQFSSRLSKQLTMQPKKEREMTFSKNQVEKDKQDLFSLNINPTQVGNSPHKNSNKKAKNLLDQIEQIEEESPYRSKKNSKKFAKTTQPFELEQSSAETSGVNFSKNISEIKNQINRRQNRETGKFTEHLDNEIQQLLEEDKEQSSKAEGTLSRVFTLNSQRQLQLSPKKDSLHTLTNESLQKLDRENKSRNEEQSLLNKINNTVQETLQKYLFQMFPNQQQQQQQQTLNPSKNLNIRSSLSVISDSSQVPKTMRSGGAASSKKILIEQVHSKQSTTNLRSPLKKGSPQHEDDDMVEDPEMDDDEDEVQSALRKQEKLRGQHRNQNRRQDLTMTPPPYSQLLQQQQQQFFQSPPSYTMSPQPYQQQQQYSMPPPIMPQMEPHQMYMTPPYHMYPPSSAYPYYDPMMMAQVSHFPGPLSQHDDFMLDDFDPYANNYVSEISMIEGESPRYAIVLEDTQCQIKGDLMCLYEGDQVEVIKIVHDMDLLQCKFNNQVGFFPASIMKVIKRNRLQSKMSSSSQPRIPFNQSPSPHIQLKKNSYTNSQSTNQMHHSKSPSSTQRASQQSKLSTQPTFYMDTDRARPNFFKDKAKSSTLVSQVNNNNPQQLKMNERKQKRLEKREKLKKSTHSQNQIDESEAALIAALNF